MVDDLLANLAGGQYFSKLDFSQAYLQLPLDEQSKEYVTVNADGLHPTTKKVRAIQEACTAQNISELRSFSVSSISTIAFTKPLN